MCDEHMFENGPGDRINVASARAETFPDKIASLPNAAAVDPRAGDLLVWPHHPTRTACDTIVPYY